MEVADTSSIEKPEEVIPEDEEVTLDSIINQVTKETSKPYSEENFRTSEVISPIFGSRRTNDMPIYNDLDQDMEEVDEFLDSLKDFRKNL